MLELTGYPGKTNTPLEPFNFAHTGDWLGELWLMLRGFETRDVEPNHSRAMIESRVHQYYEDVYEKGVNVDEIKPFDRVVVVMGRYRAREGVFDSVDTRGDAGITFDDKTHTYVPFSWIEKKTKVRK